jgi:small subunit ribosomal protein S17e
LGRIRTGLIKRVSKSLIEKYPDLFTADFEANKRIVNEILDSDSKKVKIQIAGYITHLMRTQSPKQGAK